jgi:DnaJ domain
MQLPGRLRSTTVGDLLGVLHRGGATGTLELAEDQGRVHRVHLTRGLVVAVELDGASPSLAELLRDAGVANDDVLRRSLLRAMASQRLHGEVLVDDFFLAPSVVGHALRRQLLGRLAHLEKLADARISFRVAVRAPRGSLSAQGMWDAPLHPSEFLHGRRRARPRTAAAPPAPQSKDASAWRALGLLPGATLADVKRAYRRLARTVHPDLHPDASDDERRSLEIRFMELTDAYRTLVA